MHRRVLGQGVLEHWHLGSWGLQKLGSSFMKSVGVLAGGWGCWDPLASLILPSWGWVEEDSTLKGFILSLCCASLGVGWCYKAKLFFLPSSVWSSLVLLFLGVAEASSLDSQALWELFLLELVQSFWGGGQVLGSPKSPSCCCYSTYCFYSRESYEKDTLLHFLHQKIFP